MAREQTRRVSSEWHCEAPSPPAGARHAYWQFCLHFTILERERETCVCLNFEKRDSFREREREREREVLLREGEESIVEVAL